MRFIGIFLLVMALIFLPNNAVANEAKIEQPELVLAKQYTNNLNLDNYWVSEKFDGVRAYWNGHQLLTRSGNAIHAPSWFTDLLPSHMALDGELWVGYQEFDFISAVVRTQVVNEQDWQRVKFLVFDVPSVKANFTVRYQQLKLVISTINSPYIQLVSQQPVVNQNWLNDQLTKVVNQGGEGLMLRKIDEPYRKGRNDSLIKLKPYYDAEASVIGYQAGKGKYTGLLGALIVEDEKGMQFKIGTGFSDAERASPPKLGSTITYAYSGITKNGLPRFPRYLRVRKLE